MSYDIYLNDPKTNKPIELNPPLDLRGGTYCQGGTNIAWLNITYNYFSIFQRVIGGKGIRTIYGMTGKDSIPILENAIAELEDDTNVEYDYWKPTESNVKKALLGLKLLAEKFPDGIWQGD